MRNVLLPLLLLGLSAAAPLPEPPPMPRVPVTRPATNPADDLVTLTDGDTSFTLFTPPGYTVPADGKVSLTIHFHGTPWFVQQEHQRYGLKAPLAIFALGEGSSVYARPFKDPARFARVLDLASTELGKRGSATTRASVSAVDITSFSAGYGAVREILKQPEYVDRIRTIILCDSMYSGWDPATTRPTPENPAPTSRPLAENITPWLDFARRAAAGEKVFVFTYSQVPTPYANSAASARAVLRELGLTPTPVQKGTIPATTAPDYPLIERTDQGGLHFWGYAGIDAQAHMTHVRHLADVCKALEAAGEK